MKIAVLTPLKFEEAETFIQNHIKSLPFEMVVIYGGDFPHLSDNHPQTRIHKGCFTLEKFFKKMLGFKVENPTSYFLKKILKKEKVDLVFAEYLITGAEAVEVCEQLNIPLMAIALGYEISMFDVIKKYEDKYRSLFQYATNIFVVSEHMKTNIIALDCPENKIVYSPVGPGNDFFKIEPSFKQPQVLAVGRFVDKKAPHLTILAFQKVLVEVPNANLVIAGDGYLLNSCRDLVQALGIQKSVKFTGRITPDQHKDMLRESHLFVQHSKIAESGDSEGTPVAILEASSAGLPVVSTKHAGIPNVVLEGETGFLVPEKNIGLMAERMIELLTNKELAIKMGKKGKKFVEENFSLENHIDIISSCINKSI